MVFNPNSQSSCEYYGYEYPYTGKKREPDDYERDSEPQKKALMTHGSDYYCNQSRDYALSSTVRCECTGCHVNKNGYCEVPSLINIGPGGQCRTGKACLEARGKR